MKLSLYITGDGRALIVDEQEITHVTFQTGHGDPCDWSAGIIRKTCAALGVTEAWAEAWDNEEESIEGAIAWWHELLGTEDGFLL